MSGLSKFDFLTHLVLETRVILFPISGLKESSSLLEVVRVSSRLPYLLDRDHLPERDKAVFTHIRWKELLTLSLEPLLLVGLVHVAESNGLLFDLLRYVSDLLHIDLFVHRSVSG